MLHQWKKNTPLIILRSLMAHPMETFLVFFFSLNWHPKPCHSFGQGGPLFSGEKQHQIHPLSPSAPCEWGLSFHAVTIKHAPSTCNNSAQSHRLNKGQLQTCCKLWPYAFGSCQMNPAVKTLWELKGLWNIAICLGSSDDKCKLGNATITVN